VSAHRDPAESDLDPDAARIRQRLRALRSRYPGVVLATSLSHLHDDQVVVRAALTLPDGTSVSAHAAEPTDSTGLLDGAIEIAEQRATTRALDLLSLGDLSANAARPEPRTRPAEEPVGEGQPVPPVVDALRKASLRRSPTPSRPEPVEQDLAEDVAEPDAEPEPQPREPDRESPLLQPETEAASEPDMADYTWTHFWTWARANNLSTKGQVEQRIGRAIDSLTPADVRQLLHETGVPL
jgi:hypothetical protein